MKSKLLKSRLFYIELALVIMFFLQLYSLYNGKVRAKTIELTNDGQTVAVLTTNDNGEPTLRLYGKDGRSLQLTPDGINGWNTSGRVAFMLKNVGAAGSEAYGPGLTLFDSNRENRAALYLSEGSPFLTFTSYHDMINGHGRSIATNLLMNATTQTAYMELSDTKGDIIWQAPDNKTK